MIGLDTDVIVRYLAQDDARQSALATRFIERAISPESPGYVTSITLCEVVWVLAECYAADRAREHQDRYVRPGGGEAAGIRTPAVSRFDLFIGIDYSGAQTPTTRLKNLQVYAAKPGRTPGPVKTPAIAASPATGGKNLQSVPRYWTRSEIAHWLIGLAGDGVPT